MNSKSYDEDLLLQQVAMGDESAFTQLFHQYHHLLGHHIYKLTESREMTEEIVQDVFLKIWNIREGLSEINDFKSWIYTVAKNRSINALKQVARQRVKHKQWERDIIIEEGVDEVADKWEELIEKAIELLPTQQKKVYRLSRQEGFTYQQIAEEMDLQHETVKYYMKLAIASITRQIKKETGVLITLMLLSRF